MPSPLKEYKKDPNGKGRGNGLYYLRGGGLYSKYSIARDKKKLSKGYQKSRTGRPITSKITHTGDGFLPR